MIWVWVWWEWVWVCASHHVLHAGMSTIFVPVPFHWYARPKMPYEWFGTMSIRMCSPFTTHTPLRSATTPFSYAMHSERRPTRCMGLTPSVIAHNAGQFGYNEWQMK